MAKNENETQAGTTETTTETTAIIKGLQVRQFEGQIDQTPDEKDKAKKKFLKFNYSRICFPWSRTGKDKDDKDVSGAVPSLSELMAFLQSESQGFSVEISLGSDNKPNKSSIVELLCDGWNRNEQMNARAKAENTPESAKSDAIRLYAKRMGISVEAAEKELAVMFGK